MSIAENKKLRATRFFIEDHLKEFDKEDLIKVEELYSKLDINNAKTIKSETRTLWHKCVQSKYDLEQIRIKEYRQLNWKRDMIRDIGTAAVLVGFVATFTCICVRYDVRF